jgi:hypothetical protein
LGVPNESDWQFPVGDLWSRHAVTVWVKDRWDPMPQLTVVGGVGLNMMNLPDPTTTAAPPKFRVDQQASASLELYYAPLPQLSLYGSYGRSPRFPTIAELSESYAAAGAVAAAPFLGRFMGNVALAPSTINALQASAEWTQQTGQIRARIRATGFYTHLSGSIDAVNGPATAAGTIAIANRPTVQIFGGEAEARLFPARRTSAWLNVSIFRARDATSATGYLTDQPQERLNLGLSMPLGDLLNLDALVEAGGERRSNTRTAEESNQPWVIANYSWLTLQLRTETFAQRFSATVTVQNALGSDRFDDAPRTDLHPVPRAGRGFFATLNAAY